MGTWSLDRILYEDREVLVCHKPAGIAVQSARLGQKDMVSILNNYLAERARESQKEAELVRVVHRLDQTVEGVLVFAKTKRAAAGLSAQAADGSMEKVYQAVCRVTKAGWQSLTEGRTDGKPEEERLFELCDYLAKDGRSNTSSVVQRGQRDAKEARLKFRILGVYDECMAARNEGNEHCERISGAKPGESSVNMQPGEDGKSGVQFPERVLAEIYLETGRHHQIRVQMAHAGLPLIGDRKYGDAVELKCCGKPESGVRTELALCAVRLSFRHPATKKRMTFEVKPENEVFRETEKGI